MHARSAEQRRKETRTRPLWPGIKALLSAQINSALLAAALPGHKSQQSSFSVMNKRCRGTSARLAVPRRVGTFAASFMARLSLNAVALDWQGPIKVLQEKKNIYYTFLKYAFVTMYCILYCIYCVKNTINCVCCTVYKVQLEGFGGITGRNWKQWCVEKKMRDFLGHWCMMCNSTVWPLGTTYKTERSSSWVIN